MDQLERRLAHQPGVRTRNRKPMDPDKRLYVAPWELRLGDIRVYYAVEEEPKKVIVLAVGVKQREKLLHRRERSRVMKTMDIDQASIRDYGRSRRKETWVLTRRGRPVAAVVPLRDGMDAETFAVSHDPAFIEIVNRAWASYEEKGGVSSTEARRRLGVDKPARKVRRRRR